MKHRIYSFSLLKDLVFVFLLCASHSLLAIEVQTGINTTYNKELAPKEAPGNALEFDGIDDFVDFKKDLKIPKTSFTQEFWMLSKSSDEAFHGILGSHDKSTKDRCPSVWLWGENSIHYGFGDGDKWHHVTVDNVFTPNRWYHIALTFDGSNYKLYVNGLLKHNFIVPTGVTPENLSIKWIGKVDNFFKGMLDEVRIWNTVRSQEEISGSMNTELNGDEEGLIAYYTFDATGGNHLDDKTDNKIDGTLQNFDKDVFVESYAMVVPVLGEASNITSNSFTANWDTTQTGTYDKFIIEVATDASFSNFVNGYDSLDCDTALFCNVTGLEEGVTYYYRIYAYKASVGSVSSKSLYKTVTTLALKTQSISFDSIPSKVFGDADFVLNASASSGLAVSFTSSDTLIAKLINGKISIVGAGSCSIKASQDGNSEFSPATEVSRLFSVDKATATITLSNLSAVYDGSSKSATVATVPENLPILITYDGKSELPINAGTYAVNAVINDANYKGSINDDYIIEKQTPTIIEWPLYIDVIDGECVGNGYMEDGHSSCEGAFALLDSSFVPNASDSYIEIVFIPLDTINYCCVTNNVELKVGVMTSVFENVVDVMIYPTFTQGVVSVKVGNNEKYECKLYGLNGMLLSNYNFASSRSRLDLSDQASGIYILQTIQNGKIINISRVIKR